ncbi:PfkB family carbohydrate kinase [Mucisphaera calidilacus]|uniref:PfkB family carbohydrate kinase n=1 Tax=Mucisphaera calidilacus TaxID=2527982 RepID=A0A518BZF0_9BACT|nr:PfkB family carbohydrate kinase [Mucisphaera calidilacus]QDU72357.1 pfkB family carbohydrate kinase [Mucisphaera calidilacus]
MTDRTAVAHAAAAGLRAYGNRAERARAVVGFDGFVDSIIRVVDQREDATTYTSLATIADFGGRVSAAAGKSANFEFVTTLQKLGGNGPIMANAMAAGEVSMTYLGSIGYPEPDPIFQELVDRSQTVIPLAEAGRTDALEFDDGKLMLGKYAHLLTLGADRIRETIGVEKMVEVLAETDLLAMINWTMMPGTQTIWELLRDEILPGLDRGGRERLMVFFDLCDPAKRTMEDLQEALKVMSSLQEHADVILGMNLAEATHVVKALGLPAAPDPEAEIETTAVAVREALDTHAAVVHPRAGAAACRVVDGAVHSAAFAGPFVKHPRLSTGAGDNFNAGFCLGLLAGLELEQCLCTGTATSGFYVRNAASPTLNELAGFCDELPDPEAGR